MTRVQVPEAGSDHRRLLADSVADFGARATDVARARRLRGSREEYDRAVWRKMAELGWLGILVPERHGGLGLGLAEMAIVAKGLARTLAPEPLTASAVLAASALMAGDNEPLKREQLPRLVAGEMLPALAWQEAAGELEPAAAGCVATPLEGGFQLAGTKRYVAGSAQADAWLVTARAGAELLLLWVPRDAQGARLALETTADGRAFGTLGLKDVLVPKAHVVAKGQAAVEAVELALDRANAIAAAELAGVMERALEMTLDYLRTRVQFGRPIGSFQALQHRSVDLHIHGEVARAVLDEGLAALDRGPDPRARAAIASRLKARCADAALKITREAIQLHGGIGFTDEYDAGLYLKRAMTLAAWLGGATWHRRRYASLTAGAMADGKRLVSSGPEGEVNRRMAEGKRSGAPS
jgi:alkylation response protein AidB-like acyl-CoA dehydrogenase